MTNGIGFPQPALEGQIRLGRGYTEDATDYWWNRAYDDGTQVAAEVKGWDSLDAITPLEQVGGRDGAQSGPPSFGPRMLTLTALLVAPTPALRAEHFRRIRSLLVPSGRNAPRVPIVLEMFDHGAARRLALAVRPIGRIHLDPIQGSAPGGEAGAIGLGLVAPNPPWKVSSGLIEWAEAGLLNPALLGGRTYDKTYDYTYGASGSPGGELQVLNAGDRDASPVFYVTGPAPTPLIQNVTTGQSFGILGTVPAGATVRIDARTVNPTSYRLFGRPFTLAPGLNTIRWRTVTDSYDPAALLRVEWRSTYA
jgi:hypothetical protein